MYRKLGLGKEGKHTLGHREYKGSDFPSGVV